MSKIRSMMVGLLVMAGVAGVAGAQAPQSGQPRARGEHGRHRRDGEGRDRGAMRGLLRGITLGDAEKTRLETVGAKYRGQFKTIRESMRPDFEAARAARQRGDTVAARAAFAKTANQRAQLQAVTERMRADARAALAPEHRAQFDANVVKLKERMANRREDWGKARGERGKRGRRS